MKLCVIFTKICLKLYFLIQKKSNKFKQNNVTKRKLRQKTRSKKPKKKTQKENERKTFKKYPEIIMLSPQKRNQESKPKKNRKTQNSLIAFIL